LALSWGYIISLINHRNCPCSFLRCFLYQQPSIMTDSPVGPGLTPEGTEPPPPPDPDEGHSETMCKQYNCAKVTLPAVFHLQPVLSSSLLLTNTPVPNPTSLLRSPATTMMTTSPPCATMRLHKTNFHFLSHQPSKVTFAQDVNFNRKSKPRMLQDSIQTPSCKVSKNLHFICYSFTLIASIPSSAFTANTPTPR
jgi:hypothetical protein